MDVRFEGILNATALNDRLYVTRDGVDDKYLDTALDGDLRRSFRAIVDDGSNLPLPVAFDMRAGRGIDAYLETLGIPLVQGRRFAADYREGGPDVAIISASTGLGVVQKNGTATEAIRVPTPAV